MYISLLVIFLNYLLDFVKISSSLFILFLHLLQMKMLASLPGHCGVPALRPALILLDQP